MICRTCAFDLLDCCACESLAINSSWKALKTDARDSSMLRNTSAIAPMPWPARTGISSSEHQQGMRTEIDRRRLVTGRGRLDQHLVKVDRRALHVCARPFVSREREKEGSSAHPSGHWNTFLRRERRATTPCRPPSSSEKGKKSGDKEGEESRGARTEMRSFISALRCRSAAVSIVQPDPTIKGKTRNPIRQ